MNLNSVHRREKGLKYVRYWWQSNSEIDPQKWNDKYYRVKFDILRRPVIVEEYNTEHQLLGIIRLLYKGLFQYRSNIYDAQGILQFYELFKTRWWGWVDAVERYSPDGRLLAVFDEDL